MAVDRAYLFPHPPLAVDGVGADESARISHTLEALEKVSREIAQYAPETIVFIAPHGTAYADYFHISAGLGASGDFSRFGAPQVQLSVDYDTDLAKAIADAAAKRGIPAGVGTTQREPLGHGVLVPLYFIDAQYRQFEAVCISQSGMDPTAHYRLGQCITEAVASTGRRAILVASGDLSHRLAEDGPYGFDPDGPYFDKKVILALDATNFFKLFKISDKARHRAGECGYNSLMVLAGCFDRRDVTSEVLSYEYPFGVGYAVASFTGGPPDEARAFLVQYERWEAQTAAAEAAAEDEYCKLARRSLEHMVRHGKHMKLDENVPAEMFDQRAGVFVSLHMGDQLRGCIGTLAPTTESVAHEIVHNAISAGFNDNRFRPVHASELPYLVYKVDVLSEPEPIASTDELDPKHYGVIVSDGDRRGLLLPDLEGVDTVEQQVAIARKKAGIDEGEPVKLQRFTVTRHE